MGLDVAEELVLTGKVVNGEEARQLGLVTRVCADPLTEALKMAGEIAQKSPDSIIAGKRLLETAWHGTPEEGLKLEEELQKSLLGSPNQVEAIHRLSLLLQVHPAFGDQCRLTLIPAGEGGSLCRTA